MPLFDYTVNNFTPAYLDYYRALNIMRILDYYGALTIDAPDENQLTIKANLEGVLTPAIERRDRKAVPGCLIREDAVEHATALWLELKRIFNQQGNRIIVLKTKTKDAGDNILQTRSGLGALSQARYNLFAFLPDELFDNIKFHNASSKCRDENSYYTRGDRTPLDSEITNEYWAKMSNGRMSREDAYLLAKDRSYILIRRSPVQPRNAYVAVQRRSEWFSIDDDDGTSKRNFALLGQILTIQSVDTEPKAPLPSIVFPR